MADTLDGARVWYFAYGSNMQTATLSGRRGVEYGRAIPARVAGWRLVFDKPPLLAIGGGYATIVAEPGAEVLGVLFELTAEALERIELTEGVRIGNYRRIDVRARPLAGPSATVPAATLACDRRDSQLRPSERYMACIIEGAREHGLPETYLEWLRAVPAEPETAEALRLRPLLDQALRGLGTVGRTRGRE